MALDTYNPQKNGTHVYYFHVILVCRNEYTQGKTLNKMSLHQLLYLCFNGQKKELLFVGV